MPYVQLPGSVSLYYEQPHSPHDYLQKPSLVLIAPSWTNVLALAPYVEALKDSYNLTLLELRSHGRSKNPVVPEFDYFVGAVDVAFAMESLKLPPSHIFAAGGPAFQTAVKLTLLFPSQVLSLILVGVATFFAEPRNKAAFQEVDDCWFGPESSEEFVEVLGAISDFLFGDKRPGEDQERIKDWLISTIARKYNPFKGREVWMAGVPNHRHPRLTPELLATIKQPILMIQGERDLAFPIEDIETFTKCFTSAKEMQFQRVSDGPHLLALSHSSLVISLMTQFLSRHPSFSSSPVPLSPTEALSTLSRIGSNPSITSRDPQNPLSYSLVSNQELLDGQARLEEMLRGEKECMLVLPMCHEMNDWEEPTTSGQRERKLRRWRWSTRHENAHQYVDSRPLSQLSLEEGNLGGVTVEVDQVRGSEKMVPPLPTFVPAVETA
ncbi:alpha/beta fold hydrolase [Sporobolomyces salmoneus]|uniref:alpha/beta fold hydrolase n=1 Tax=Sporobolomyces salmoneus TaxID=183962 RepID=UPI0031753015